MSVNFGRDGFVRTFIKVLEHNDWGYVTHPYNYDNWKYVGTGSFLGGSLISAFLLGQSARSGNLLCPFGPTITSLAVGVVCFVITARPRTVFIFLSIQSFFEIGRSKF